MRARDSRRGSAAGWVRAASGVVAAGMAAVAWMGSLPLRAGAPAAAPAASGSAPAVFTVATPEGPLRIAALGHASLMFHWNGRVIHVDPWSRVADYSSVPKADQVWITHEHADHLDLDALRAARAVFEARGIRYALADHRVSQSLYVNDPDGNGIELYVDADPRTWREDPSAVATVRPLEL